MTIEIIAEVAQGYEGNPKILELLTLGALSTDCDAIKYQLVFADELATPDYKYFDLFTELEMDEQQWIKNSHLVKQNQKKLYFDIFGSRSLQLAKDLNADGVKISTTEFYNQTLFLTSLERFDQILLSVGGIPFDDIKDKLENVDHKLKSKIKLLYGLQSEPTNLRDNNLNKLKSFKRIFPYLKVGFMDHSAGNTEDAQLLSLLAMGAGAELIEKHLTLDHSLQLEDFISGITPADFADFVRKIRKFEVALGSSSLDLSEKEQDYRNKASKSVVALTDLKAYDELSLNNVALKRSGTSIGYASILTLEEVVGKRINKDITKHSQILKDDL